MTVSIHAFRAWTLVAFAFAAMCRPLPAGANETVVIGLSADMSSASRVAGEAIRRGALLAIQEINDKGGLLGKPVELRVRDHRGNPTRGLDNMLEFANESALLAVVGGLHTPVVLHELETVHRNEIIYLIPWAAGTPIIDNGYDPSYVFRVSVRDEFAGGYLIGKAAEAGLSRFGLMLERTGWGRSNERAMTEALTRLGLAPRFVGWFNWNDSGIGEAVNQAIGSGIDVLMLVANPTEGKAVLEAVAAQSPERRVPVVSHWGITGGSFGADAKDAVAAVDLTVLQTFSFLRPPVPERAIALFQAYRATFKDVAGEADVLAAPGTAHAYDLVRMLALAVERAGSFDRATVRDAMESIDFYAGVMKDYDPPFAPDRHDALTASSFILVRYDEGGHLRPVDGILTQ